MKISETIKNISLALNKAQSSIGAAKKDASNPFFKSKYADLGSIMQVCKDELNKNGISVLQPVGFQVLENGHTIQYLETTLLHGSGEYISERMFISIAKPNDPQAQGSAISYARRYSLQSMMFIPSEDDDAESAVVRTSDPERKVVPITRLNSECRVHAGQQLIELNKKDGSGTYFAHKTEDGKLCFGK
jgi:hypothetical protein